MSEYSDPPDGPCEECGAIDVWDCICDEDGHPGECVCCQAPTAGSTYCDACLSGECPDCA